MTMQESSHRDAVHLLITADRRSLTAELGDIRAEMESVRRELQAAKDQHVAELRQVEEHAAMVQLHSKQRGKRQCVAFISRLYSRLPRVP